MFSIRINAESELSRYDRSNRRTTRRSIDELLGELYPTVEAVANELATLEDFMSRRCGSVVACDIYRGVFDRLVGPDVVFSLTHPVMNRIFTRVDTAIRQYSGR